jgi:predicted O-methyltransferase YrrM
VRLPTVRSLTVSAVAGSAAVAAVVLVLGAFDVFAFTDSIQLSVSVATLGLLAAIMIGQRRVDGKVQRLTRSHRKHADNTQVRTAMAELRTGIQRLGHQVDEVTASLGEDRVLFAIHSGYISRGLQGVEQRITDGLSGAERQVESMAASLAGEISGLQPHLDKLSVRMKALERAGEVNYSQLEAFVDLRGAIRPRAPMPALRGWAASPDVVRLLAETLWAKRPKLIVECGSGASSIWLGYLAEQIGSAKVVALEHDERFAEISRDLVQAHGLADVVDIRLAPLLPWNGPGNDEDASYPWYDRAAIEDLADIGLLFIDGPPGQTGPHARFPAMPLLLPRCTQDVVIVLDDTLREEESAISDLWLTAYPELERVTRRLDKGAHVFTRRVT